jgi:hypothetical protein
MSAPPAPPSLWSSPFGVATTEPIVRYLTDDQLSALMMVATLRPDLAWEPHRDLGSARNAHETNSAMQMAAALVGHYDWLEGDVRLGPSGETRMAHEKFDKDGMSYDEWLSIGIASGRGLKIDVKEAGAILPAVEAAKRRGVPAHRLIVNVTVYGDTEAQLTHAQLKRIRALYPDVVINLSVTTKSYTPDIIHKLQKWARLAGGPVMFPLRWDAVDQGTVNALRKFGRIAIWNSPDIKSPSDIGLAAAQLRAMGVDGTIDLRLPSRGASITGPIFDALVSTLGWSTALRVLKLLDRSIGVFEIR